MKIGYAIAAALLLSSSAARAQSTIDFQDIAAGSCAYYGPSVVSGGFTFTGNEGLYGCSADLIGGNSSNALISANSVSVVGMSAQDGSTFTLNSFYAGTRTSCCSGHSGIDGSYGQTTSIALFGNIFGGGTITGTVNLDATSPYDFMQFVVGWSNLTSVSFTAQGSGDGPEFLIDDIAVNGVVATPEPASLSLVLIGLGGIVAVRKRRRA